MFWKDQIPKTVYKGRGKLNREIRGKKTQEEKNVQEKKLYDGMG